MGQFINVGLITSIETSFNQQTENSKLEELYKAIKEDVNIDLYLYDMNENKEGCITFNLKSSCFGENLVSFLKNQAEISSLFKTSERVLEEMTQIHNLQSLKDYFHDDFRDKMQIMSFGKFRIHLNNTQTVIIELEALSLTMAGKILLEEGEEIFSYFEKNIHFQDHPLAKCIKVEIF